jgi:hypothetical protein
LVGSKSNRDGIGAAVKVSNDSFAQYDTVRFSKGYSSSSASPLYFGLGSADTVKVEVRWPSGVVQTLTNVKIGRIVEVREPDDAKNAPGAQ